MESPFRAVSIVSILHVMADIPPEICFQYVLPQPDFGFVVLDVDKAARAITSTFQAFPIPGVLTLNVPSIAPAPSADTKFRAFAHALLHQLPGLPFFVLGGGSAFSRELLLASLPNFQAAGDASGNIVARFPTHEIQEIFHHHFAAMLAFNILEQDAIEQLSLLSRSMGMSECAWG